MEVMSGMFQPGLGRGGWRGWRNDLGRAGMMLVVGECIPLVVRRGAGAGVVLRTSVPAATAVLNIPQDLVWKAVRLMHLNRQR